MPIAIGLLLCIPIGFLFYLEARWLIRRLFKSYEKDKRRAALLFSLLGALVVPIFYCFGRLEDAFPGRSGETIANGFLLAVLGVFFFPIYALLSTEGHGDD